MLNLSDKELDRFSQEAAQEYEPGEVLGPRSWDRLEVRINQEFGHSGWNPFSHIRRFPFFYAPVLLVLLGVTYFLVRPGNSSGSSPGQTVKAPTRKTSVQNQNPTSTDKATSTPATSATTTPAETRKDGSAATAPGGAGDGAAGSAGVAPAGNGVAAGAAANAKGNGVAAGGNSAVAAGETTSATHAASGNVNAGVNTANANGANAVRGGTVARGGRGAAGGDAAAGRDAAAGGTNSRQLHGRRRSTANNTAGVAGGTAGNLGATHSAGDAGASVMANTAGATNGATTGVAASRELHLSSVQRPHSLGKRNVIGDSALRAFTTKSTAPTLIKKKGIYRINRNWQFGLTIAPDFTSVNSLAGDKAGSSFGLTVDYQFAPHWYISTGILASRKNYAARAQDYHAPPTFYQGIFGNASFIKGSFYMLEIPLNLRYDFTVSGNTLFFVSGGASSYLMTSENANLYWQHFNVEMCSPMDHLPIHKTNLFSCVNLSAGVETGLTNSLSLVIAPYMKLPTQRLGLGQVQMNSVGIDFTLKWSPITSRRKSY